MSPRRTPRAFTLIELLIVVAIIAILAAIAVPNFLEAQVRAKAARVKNDMRVLRTALETYIVDYNRYPVHVPAGQFGDFEYFRRLTTPVAYLTSVPVSPFNEWDVPSNTVTEKALRKTNYEYWPTATMLDDARFRNYAITSVGPDNQGTYGLSGYSNSFQNELDRTPAFINGIYDATNGTISIGDMLMTPRAIY